MTHSIIYRSCFSTHERNSLSQEDVKMAVQPALDKARALTLSNLFRHHGRPLRGLDHIGRSSVDAGFFGRMFRSLPPAPHQEKDLAQLGAAMIIVEAEKFHQVNGRTTKDSPITDLEPADENPTIPSGYTYLGQFIDHDISFDPASSLQKTNDPDALEDFRTPRLDLDSLYGAGPDDQPYLYTRASGFTEFLIGRTLQPNLTPSATEPDLPRNSERVALTGDKRNDENKIVTQIHRLFLQLHNKVIHDVPSAPGDKEHFKAAQRQVRYLYQWMILHDFLPKICGQKSLDKVLNQFPKNDPLLPHYHPKSGLAYMPVEFSVAAYRFGHSMVRPSYSLNETVHETTDQKFSRVPIFSTNPDPRANLNGFDFLPAEWKLDWSFFFDGLPRTAPTGFRIPQHSYRIDTQLVEPLIDLPEFSAKFKADPTNPNNIPNLALRNLRRGFALQLPSGQAVAKKLGQIPIPDDVLWASEGDRLKKVLDACPNFKHNAPLWFYILKEAELTKRDGVTDPDGGGHHLGPVGAQIVAEVFVGLLWYDHQSYLHQDRNFKPGTPYTDTPGVFGMTELIRYVTK